MFFCLNILSILFYFILILFYFIIFFFFILFQVQAFLAYILQGDEKNREKAVLHFKQAIKYHNPITKEDKELNWAYHRDLMKLLRMLKQGPEIESVAKSR
jgi:hypothetical protein